MYYICLATYEIKPCILGTFWNFASFFPSPETAYVKFFVTFGNFDKYTLDLQRYITEYLFITILLVYMSKDMQICVKHVTQEIFQEILDECLRFY